MLELIVLSYSCFLLLLQIILDINRKKFSFFDPKHLFQLYFIIQLPLSAFLAKQFGSEYIDHRILFNFDEDIRLRLLIYIFVGHTLFFVGVNTFSKISLKLPSILLKPWSTTNIRIIMLGLLLLGYFSFFLLIKINGGFSAFLSEREVWRAGGMVGQGILILPCTSLLGTLGVIYTISQQKKLAKSKWKIMYIIVTIICILPAVILGFRGLMLIPLLQMLVAYNFAIKKIPLRLLVKAGVFFVVSFTSYGIYRELGFAGFYNMSDLIKERPDLLFNIFLRSRGSDVFSRVIQVLDWTQDYQHGLKLLIEAVTIFVPTAIWEGKPTPLSVTFSQTFFGINGGVSPTVLGELYWHGGIFGIIVGMYILGMFMSLIYNTLLNNIGRESVILIYAQLFTTFVMIAEAISGYLNGLVLFGIYIAPIILFASYKSLRINR